MEKYQIPLFTFSNKAHDGFCGDSVIGHWVNIGSGTQISNLKNNYNSIKIGPNRIDTSMQFLGAMIGDYAKCSISTSINCGTRIGFGAHLFGTTVTLW